MGITSSRGGALGGTSSKSSSADTRIGTAGLAAEWLFVAAKSGDSISRSMVDIIPAALEGVLLEGAALASWTGAGTTVFLMGARGLGTGSEMAAGFFSGGEDFLEALTGGSSTG